MTTSSLYNSSAEEDVHIFPASFTQQHLWFLDRLEPGTAPYGLSYAIRINNPLDVAALEQSLHVLTQRHKILRTTFIDRDGQLMQMIAPTLAAPLSVVNLQSLPEDQREVRALRFAVEEAQRPFDLAHGPLLRTMVLVLGPQEHILLVGIHNIICDNWSIGALFRELGALYEAFFNGRSAALPDLPFQFTDFAVWQRKWLQSEKQEEHLDYWKQRLRGASPVLELPSNRPVHSAPTNRGSSYLFKLPKHLSEALKALSHQQGVSFYTTLVAAFQTLLYRYTEQEDMLLGSMTADHPQAETKDLIGVFMNMLVLRTDLSGNPTFRELLERVRKVLLEAQAHQNVPFEYLVKELQPDRSVGQTPFFQVLIALAPPEPALPPGWTFVEMPLKTHTTRFNLHLELKDRAEGILGRLEYNTDLFDESSIARIMGHWEMLLEGIVKHPDQHLSHLPLLTQLERQQLLVEWNATQSEYPGQRCIHQLFEEQVERTPDAIAVIFENARLTYRELNIQANQLAHHLRRRGVGPEVRVGLCVERSLDMVVGLLGILKAEGAYVPLDPAYPRERLAFMLEDAHISVLVTQESLVERLPGHEARVVCLDSDLQAIAQENEENRASGITGENLAYMIYTSGSTGRPKAVLGRHRASINRFHWMWTTYAFNPDEVCCQKTSLSFVDSIWEIFGPLLQGIRIVIIPDLVVTDHQQLLQTLAAHAVTRIVLVPSLLRVLLDTKADLQQQLPNLKYCISSGEAFSLDLALRFLNSMPHCVLLNLYGSSEVAADATCYNVPHDPTLTCMQIGRPIANTQIYLLDRHMQLVPIGVPGELHVGGDGLARGYFNRPELTAAKFVPNPFSAEPGALLYKTGDQARYLPDGNIEYLGRLDHQVKIRGFRIELGEIEAVLAQHPVVQQAVVVAREDVPGDQRLVAYVVLQPEQTATPEDLQQQVALHVPSYMVPFAFVLLEAFPLTPNGKIDRKALPAPEYARLTPEATFVAPRTTLEIEVASILSQALGIEHMGIHDDFFALGGHSLLAMQVISRLQARLQVEVPLRSFFDAPTVAQLAEMIARLPSQQDAPALPAPGAFSRAAYRVQMSSLPGMQERRPE